MTKPITLNLTLKELQQIDKFVEINDDTLSVIMKIENAYPKQKSPAEEAYKRVYCRYPDKYGSSWDIFEKGYARAQKDYKVGEYEPTPQERGDRIHKEVEKLLEKNWYVDAKDLIESETSPPEPTSTVFRQKLFDGIKSVFYDPDYERTHWKMKVDMAVDEVLTHFYDIIPDEDDAPYSGYDKGWNRCIKTIKECMEHTDD